MVLQVERDEVERPIVAQLVAMGWTHVPGKVAGTLDTATPLLTDRLDPALRRINPWMGNSDVRRAIAELANVPLGQGVARANFDATDLLLSGCILPNPSAGHGGPSAVVQYVRWHEEEATTVNDFTVVDQLRIRDHAGKVSILDIVLFVNGIPLVVVECKSPDLADPLHDAVVDLRHYAGDPLRDEEASEPAQAAGAPELFRTVQLLVAATAETAYLGTITATPDHYHPWRSIEPETERGLRSELPPHVARLNERHKLIGVVLRPAALLTIVRHYVIPLPIETESGGTRTIMAVARHQQYRATEKALRRLLTGRQRGDAVPEDERGGIVWHTQGSGKSLTMTFLVRRIHLHHQLSEFMVVIVTDRTQLQKQLEATLKLSESEVVTAKRQAQMEALLRDGGRRVVFGMIQKYGAGGGVAFAGETESEADDRDLAREYRDAVRTRMRGATEAEEQPPVPRFPECNTSPDIVVFVDEAHRSHTNVLHAALRKAMPSAAKIGFTGTPIMTGKEEDTRRIFGGGPDGAFIDTYRMAEAERDGVVVRIRYEGRTGEGKVFDKDGLDRRFEDLVRDRTREERAALLRRWPTERDVAESEPMIRAKAEDILEHFVTTVLPGGYKAQVAAVSRRAAVAYRRALLRARDQLLAELADFDPESVAGTPRERLPRRQRYLYEAYLNRALLRRMEFVPVFSQTQKDGKGSPLLTWTDAGRQEAYIRRFHQPFPQLDEEHEWVASSSFGGDDPDGADGEADHPWSESPEGAEESRADEGRKSPRPDPVHPDSPIAFVIVMSMLLTGFDAPREQVLYLDRPIRDAELLQAVARVNRPMPGKGVGYVVDYYGVFENLSDALADYAQDDIDDTMRGMADEIEALAPAAEQVRAFLREHGVTDADVDDLSRLGSAALVFEDDAAARVGFDEVLQRFLDALERVLPHEHGLDFIADARRWSLLQKRVRHLLRDTAGGAFTLRRYGRKVRELIRDHLEAPEIKQVIAPVSLLSLDFDDRVRTMPPREAAAEMEHAIRFHLEERVRQEDPERYARLSERLAEILREMPGRFEDQVRVFGPVIEQLRQDEEDEEDPELVGLSLLERRTYRYLRQLLDQAPEVTWRADLDDLPLLVPMVCEKAARVMGKASYQGQSQDLNAVASIIQAELLKGGLVPTNSAGWPELGNIAQSLASFANSSRGRFLQWARGE
ncbi:type I restriction endonuclease subunit R [Streptomyces radicis]|uniref:type I site-specific deoxyribonuclease n=1 Tax=Streptomyces radicis TaxID=1750517 RepID=A0A3A9WCW7_9ACTN|nr:type I restriction endonuclease [Streptomyces radicis]RKN10133.1 type I restriction endonuclease subunit R [Streptomyces radicis]RKN24475.1 type I restriction endonuclease subunit R [Streptomyces radicis]